MRVDTELRDIPVIMISAVEDLDSVVRCIELGAVWILASTPNRRRERSLSMSIGRSRMQTSHFPPRQSKMPVGKNRSEGRKFC